MRSLHVPVLVLSLLLGACSTTEYVTPWFRKVRTEEMSWDKDPKSTTVWERRQGGAWKAEFLDKAAPVPLAEKKSIVIRSQKYVEILTEDKPLAVQLQCSRDALVSADRSHIACIDGDTIRAFDALGGVIGAYELPKLIDGGQGAYSTHVVGYVKGEATLLAVQTYVPSNGKQSPTCELYALRGASEVTSLSMQSSAACGVADVAFWERIAGLPVIERGSWL